MINQDSCKFSRKVSHSKSSVGQIALKDKFHGQADWKNLNERQLFNDVILSVC